MTIHPQHAINRVAQSRRRSSATAVNSEVRVYSTIDQLPTQYVRLFEEAGERNFFLTRAWFRNFAETVSDQGNQLRIYGIAHPEQTEPAMGMLVAQGSSQRKTAGSLRKLSALANYYTCLYGPHLAENGKHARETLQALVRAIAAEKPSWEAIEIRPLDVSATGFSELIEALKDADFLVQTFFCFGNWYLPVEGRSYAQYLEGLPSALKHTLKRKQKKLEKSGTAKIEIVTGGEGLEAAIQAYTKVYLASWKMPEPYPEFTPGLIRMCAQMGALRLGLVYVNGEPVASQLWIVHNGAALIFKLAYDERFAELSAGTILTATLMQHVLDVDKVTEVDYLSGDDPYKKAWMSRRRERWGVLAMNSRTARGAMAAAWYLGGRGLKRAASWLSRPLLRKKRNVGLSNESADENTN